MRFIYFLLCTFGSWMNYVLPSQTSDSSPLTYKEAKALTLTVPADPSTSGFYLPQTMYQVKDPKASLKFYGQILGMSLLSKMDFPSMKFILYCLGYENMDEILTSVDVDERMKWTLSKKGTLELTHNWGTENNRIFPTIMVIPILEGMGIYLDIMVPDVDAACERFEKYEMKFIKKRGDGRMKGIAFIQDPDSYWIEILSNNLSIRGCGGG